MDIYYSLKEHCRTDSDGNSLHQPERIPLVYGQYETMTIHLNGDPGNAVSWHAAVGKTGIPPLCRTLNDMIDSSRINDGIIVVPFNTKTSNFLSAVKTGPAACFFEIWGEDESGNNSCCIRFPAMAFPSVDPSPGEEIPIDPSECVSSVNGKTGAVTLDASDVGAVESPGAAGTIGQVLTKTADGTGWRDVEAYMPGVTLAPCSGLGLAQTGTGPAFSWTDPDNVILNGATLAAWARTVLVRKVGSYPADWQDGTIMAETSAALGNKNYYRDHSCIDETREEGNTYFYKLFSQTVAGDWNDLTANEYTSGLGMSWGQVQQYVRAGRGPDLFPVGTVFIVNHAEYVHPNGDGLYFRVVGHDQVPARNEALEHTMCLEMVDCLFSAPYDAPELEYALTTDTTAQGGKTYYAYNGTAYVALVEGTDWNPGDPVPLAGWYEKNLAGTNTNTGRNTQGSNNPVQNNMIQWLNSDKGIYSWFSQQTIWDLGSTRLLGHNGFVRNLDPEFLAVVQEAKLITARWNGEGGGSLTHYANFWLPSVTQLTGVANNGVMENACLQFYADGGSRIKSTLNNSTAVWWWLRSPNAETPYASGVMRSVYASGDVSLSSSAASRTGDVYISPACIIA